jgi:DNA-directed RNA polymerase subunit RPC12/RpoP
MGVVAIASCSHCGLRSRSLFLGAGRSRVRNEVVVCRTDGLVMSRATDELDAGEANCARCGAPLQRLPGPRSGDLPTGLYPCPRCGTKALRFERTGEW